MNIEIANRLVNLRKNKNLSQEALAEELGISRQAVSKWERAESSPDTSNLIMLAKLYSVSLDELLDINQEQFESGASITEDAEAPEESSKPGGDYAYIGPKGIHIKDEDNEVHIGWKGINIKSADSGVQIGAESGVYIDGEKYDWKIEFPFTLLAVAIYLFLGFEHNAWHPGWLIFGMIHIFHSLIYTIKNRDASEFEFPVLILMYIGYFGFVEGVWFPHWLAIFAIPIWSYLINLIQSRGE